VKSHFKGNIQRSQNHGNTVSNSDKNMMEAWMLFELSIGVCVIAGEAAEAQ